jgi:uncharacterized protein (TIGR01319 family)
MEALRPDMTEPRYILLTDVGSTTTKALLIAPDASGEYRLVAGAEAPTTVEAPYENVMIGVQNSIRELQSLTGRPLITEAGLIKACADAGCDIYLSTSSAGGGLQVLVCGVMKKVTAESAARAALGAGAVLLDVICVDDGRPMFQKMDLVRSLRPDMVLVSGGIDGGNTNFAVELADMLNAANPQPRFGKAYKIPLIFCGNKDAGPMVLDTAKDSFDVRVLPNIRPSLDTEVLGPARHEIHELFMSHVMAQAPGYRSLLDWVSAPILPTPAAVGRVIETLSENGKRSVVGMDIGGATTDIFSVFDGDFQRSVSANLGMSYSAANVMVTTGPDNVRRWLPVKCEAGQVSDEISTKMVFPTTLPQNTVDLMVEQAIAREALRLAYEQHKEVASGPPKEVSALKKLTMSQEEQMRSEITGLEKPWHQIDLLVGSGGVISHAPSRAQAAIMMLDAFQPKGICELVVDSVFMMPHLGVLSTLWPDIAQQVLVKDCLVPLGKSICLTGSYKKGAAAVTVKGTTAGGKPIDLNVAWGELACAPIVPGDEADLKVNPASGVDAGQGAGRGFDIHVKGGEVGFIVDARGRPIEFPAMTHELMAGWLKAIKAYSGESILRAQDEIGGGL